MFEKIKEHPYLIGGLVIGGLLLMMLLSGGSSATSTADGTIDSSDAANQFANNQAAIQGQLAAAGIQAGVQREAIAGQITLEQIRAGVASDANTLAAQVAQYTTGRQADVAINRDTLSAQVANAQTAADVSKTGILANALVSQTQSQAAVAINASNNQTATFSEYIKSLPALAHENNAAAVATANKTCKSYLWGLISDC